MKQNKLNQVFGAKWCKNKSVYLIEIAYIGKKEKKGE